VDGEGMAWNGMDGWERTTRLLMPFPLAFPSRLASEARHHTHGDQFPPRARHGYAAIRSLQIGLDSIGETPHAALLPPIA
jgi:hypothetical protein